MKAGRVVLLACSLFALSLGVALLSQAQMRTAPTALRPVGAISMRAARPMRPVATHAAPVARPGVIAVAARQGATAPFIPPASSVLNFSNGFNFQNGFYGGSGETIQQLLDPVPGPGFDYAHVSALDKDLALKAVIDPQTQERLGVAEQVLSATGGYGAPGYYLFDGGGAYVMPAEITANEQPQQAARPEVIVLQQPTQTAEESTAAQTPQPAQVVPDVGNFTLVLKTGEKIQAMAFTTSGSEIIYITPDGVRHTVAASDVNATATQKLNQDSGRELRF
jgi:hypothetical protein